MEVQMTGGILLSHVVDMKQSKKVLDSYTQMQLILKTNLKMKPEIFLLDMEDEHLEKKLKSYFYI